MRDPAVSRSLDALAHTDVTCQYRSRIGFGEAAARMAGDVVRVTSAIYDASAAEYARRIGTELNPEFDAGFDVAMLAGVAESLVVRGGPVLDLGCGPGRVAAFLNRRGIDVIGIDLSRGMLRQARQAHPTIPLSCGPLAALPIRSASVAGAVCWYSIIHTAPADLAAVFAEIHRVCQDTADVLVAFQTAGGERVDRPDAYGTGMTMTSYRHSVDDVAAALSAAGLLVVARAVREPVLEHETTQQGFVVARAAHEVPRRS
jgi:SAM-dependent methyltransferase